MSTIGFKRYSVIKIFFNIIKNSYKEAYKEHLSDKSRMIKIFSSIYFLSYAVFYSPLLLIKIWENRNEINKELEKKYKQDIFHLLLNIKNVFPNMNNETAKSFSNGLGYGFLAFYLNEVFPKFQMVSEKLLENGWFINDYHSLNIEGDPEQLIFSDEYNIKILRKNLDTIEKLAIQRFPNRIEALKKSFRHHRSKDYLSSISVLLPQIDGIFRELTSKELFSKVKKKNPQSWLEEIQQSGKEGLHHLLLSPLKREEYFGANFSEALEHPKIFSRNRILHGEDMEMNDETKSFKVISLLLYIISNVYDAVNEDEDNPRLKDYFDGLEELKNRL